MSIDAMKQALEALELWCPASGHALNKRAEAVVALRAAIKEAQGLAEKVPAKGTLLEQTLRKVWDEMPHPDYQKEMEQELVCVCGAIWEGQELVSTPLPRQWQGLTEDEKNAMVEWAHPDIIDAIELKLRERNT